MPRDTLTLLLAGGQGSRLHPLTRDRAKPAVPFGGKYRVIDFTLSNCLQSGLRKILVLTQYKSQSLHRHLRDGWSIFNPECGEFITTVPPQMRGGDSWYQGTADAVHQNLYMLERHKGDKALILAGDHIYRMDYAAMLQFHEEKGADLTIACMQVPASEACAFGVMKIDGDHRILDFKEKPEHPDPLPNDPSMALVSMGIYVFSMSRLIRALNEDHEDPNSSHDFGKDIIPRLVESDRVYAYSFGEDRGRVTPDRYWRDVGTIDAYYEANMDLLEPIPPLNLYQDDWAIRTYHSQNPPARMVPGTHGEDGLLVNSILGSGAIIMGGIVRHAILSSRVRVHTNAIIENAIVFEDVTVGEDVVLRKCIVDKGVRIPPGECIGVDLEHDAKRFTVSEKGIVVVPRHYQF